MVLAGLLAVFFICFVSRNHHLPWGDEVQTIDAAVNSYYGAGFRSMVYRNQNDQKFWAGNVPLYGFVACLWTCVFGFSNASVRVLNYMLLVLALLAVWLAVLRLQIIASARQRLAMITVLLSGEGITYACMNLRYDAWSLLLCAAGLLFYTASSGGVRAGGLFAIGVMMPLSGVHLPPYVLMLSAVFLLFLGWGVIRQLVPLYSGILLGIGSLFGLYWWKGVIPEFLAILHNEGGQSLGEKIQHLGYYFRPDRSLLCLVALLLVLLLWRGRRPGGSVALRLGLAIGLGLPVALFLMRRFVLSYAWAVYVPVVVCLFVVLVREWRSFATARKAVVVAMLISACGLGLPKTLAGMALQWSIRDYGIVERFVAGKIEHGAVVMCDPAAYFAIKPHALQVYTEQYEQVISAEERRSIQVLVIDPKDRTQFQATLGGNWAATGADLSVYPGPLPYIISGIFHSRFGYRLAVYRRVDQLTSSPASPLPGADK
ncbi:MAG TPA: hypothetical protein VGR48_17140 [Terriglobales bacterium]|nr:hypothetical protein [Terriglobales bacterium]